MASYCLLYKNQSSCIVECDYVSRNLGVVHNFLVQDTSLNIRSYYHHIQHFCTFFYLPKLESDLSSHPSQYYLMRIYW